MKRPLSSWLLATSVLAAFGANPFAAEGDEAEDIDLIEIRQRLNAWRGSFVNLRVVWELYSLPTTTDKPLPEWSLTPELVKNARLFSREEWIWADHGLDLVQSDTFLSENEGVRSLRVFNGPKGLSFRALYTRRKHGLEVFEELTIRGSGVGKPISSLARVPMNGLYWPGTADWLPEILSKGTWKLEGFEKINGGRCLRISGRLSATVNSSPPEVLWLDLNHGLLVRRYLSPRFPSDFIVDEFQQLPNGIWFPKRARLQIQHKPYENQLWEVTEALVNISLDLGRFDPPAPVKGTLVDDGGRVYRHGGSAASQQKRGRTKRVGNLGLDDQLPVPAAKPPLSEWLWWSGGLLIVSLVFLAAGFWFRHRT